MVKRKWYAAVSYMGIEFTLDSPCWTAYVFDYKADRDVFAGASNVIPVSRKQAYKIAGITHAWSVAGKDRHGVLGDCSQHSEFRPL